MTILDVQERWIHTHFILDRGDVTVDERTLIDGAVRNILRDNHIQVGFHYIEEPTKGFTRLVLECVPLERVRDTLRRTIATTIAEFVGGGQRNPVTDIRVQET